MQWNNDAGRIGAIRVNRKDKRLLLVIEFIANCVRGDLTRTAVGAK